MFCKIVDNGYALCYTVISRKEAEMISKDNDRITTILSKEIAKQVEKLADEEKRSISAMAAILIEKGLESYKK
jgi:hypothetical protein